MSAPRAPAKLGAAGKAMWSMCWGCSWITLVDRPVVERYARLTDEREELQKAIEAGGRVARGSHGQPVTAPEVEQLRQVEQLLLRLEQALGFGPLFRARLGIAVMDLAQRENILERLARERGPRPDPRLVNINEGRSARAAKASRDIPIASDE